MKKKGICEKRRITSLIFSVIFAFSAVTTGLVIDTEKVQAATTTSSVMGGTDSYTTDVSEVDANGKTGKTFAFQEGTYYKLHGSSEYSGAEVEAMYLGKNGNTGIFVTKGMWGSVWPGIDELTLSGSSWGDLSDAISNVYLPRGNADGSTTTTGVSASTLFVYNGSSWVDTYTSNVHSALTTAAGRYSSLGAASYGSWLGTRYDASYAWFVNSYANVGSDYTSNVFVVAPCFNLDLSKVDVEGTTITYVPFVESSKLTATQSLTTVTEGTEVDLSSVISGVTYADGTNVGRNATYTVSTDNGTISGTKWTALDNINTNTPIVLTLKSTQNPSWTTSITMTVVPKSAGSIKVTTSGDPVVKVGDSIDLSNYLTVEGYDSASSKDGDITNYLATVDSKYGTISGTIFTPEAVSTELEVPITIQANQNVGSVDYRNVTPKTIKVTVQPYNTDYQDRDGKTDAEGFYSYDDTTLGVTWKYKYNDEGNIAFLFTEDDIENTKLISSGHTLVVPSTIHGVKVVGVGGGTGTTANAYHPFVKNHIDTDNQGNPTGTESASWTSVYIPTSITTINDRAFYGSEAAADITIPGNVSDIGVEAFKNSKITSLILNDANDLEIGSEAFNNCAALSTLSIRGNGVTIGKRAFKDAVGLTQLTIPNGTKFKGNDNSYAFEGTTNLELIKIDTETVYSNIFSKNAKLAEVVFGENVQRVHYDWSGTRASNANASEAVDRKTYVLNNDTVFEMSKVTGGSPFGYAKNLTVVGERKSLDGDSDAYNNTDASIVTAKVAYLATYYGTNNEVKGYAKGTADNITITISDNLGENTDVQRLTSDEQTGLEAYYSGFVFEDRNVDKDKMSVYALLGDAVGNAYDSSDFYVIRSTEYNSKVDGASAQEFVSHQTTANSGVYAANDNDEVLDFFKGLDTVTVSQADVQKGTVDVTVVVLQKIEGTNDILMWDDRQEVDTSTETVKTYAKAKVAWSKAVSIPVKPYTEEDDFLDTYGSYSAVIDKVNTLQNQVEQLQTDVASKDATIAQNASDMAVLRQETLEYQQSLTEYTNMYNNLVTELEQFTSQESTNEEAYFEKIEVPVTDGQGNPVTDENGNPVTEEKEKVYIGATTCDFVEKTEETTDEHGNPITKQKTITVGTSKYKVFTGTGDIDGDNVDDTFDFYVASDGVHVISIDPATGDVTEIHVYSDPIGAIQRKLTAQLTVIRSELISVKASIDSILNQLKTAMNISDEDFENLSIDEKVNLIVTRMNNLVAAKNQLESQISENNQKLASYEAAVDDIFDALVSGNLNKEDFATLQAKMNQILEDIDSIKTENSDLSGRIAQLNGQIRTLNDDIAAKDAEIAEKDRQIAEMSTSISTKDASIEELSQQIDALRSQAQTLSDTVEQQEATITSLESSVSTLSNINEEMQQEIDSLNASVSSLSSSNQSQAQRISTLSEELDEKQAAIDAGTATIDELTATIASARTTIGDLQAENDAQAQTISTLESSVASLNSINERQKTTIQDLNDDITDLKSQNSTLSGTIASLQETIANQTTEISELNESITAKNAEITVAKNKIDSLNAQITGYQNDLAVAQDTITQQNARIESLETSAGNYILTIDDAAELFGTSRNASKAEVKAAINAFVASKVANEKTIKDIQTKLGTTAEGDDLVALVGSNTTISSGNSATATENASLKTTVESLQSTNSSLSAQVSSLSSQNSALNTQIKNLTNALSSRSNSTSNTDSAAISSLNGQVNTLNGQVLALTNEKNALNGQVSNLTAQNNNLESQLQQLQNQKTTTASTSVSPTSSTGGSTQSVSGSTSATKTGTKNSTDNETVESPKEDSGEEGAKGESETKSSERIGVSGTLLVPETDPITTMSLPGKTNVNSKSAAVEELDGKTVFAKDILTNAASVTESSEESRDHANAIFNYYAGNLDKLAELGFEGTDTAKEDDDQVISVSSVFSVDVHPSDAQKEAMEKGEKVELSLASSDLENGKQYLLVHESTKRTGKYDVTLVTAHDKEIVTTLQDLSPVSVAKVSLENIAAFAAGAAGPAPVGTATVEQSDSTNTVFVVILIALIIGGGVGIMIFMKKKQKDGKGFNFHRA